MRIEIDQWWTFDSSSLWGIVRLDGDKVRSEEYLTKDLCWVDYYDSALMLYNTKEEAIEVFKKWLKTLKKAKRDEIFANYVANRLNPTH